MRDVADGDFRFGFLFPFLWFVERENQLRPPANDLVAGVIRFHRRDFVRLHVHASLPGLEYEVAADSDFLALRRLDLHHRAGDGYAFVAFEMNGDFLPRQIVLKTAGSYLGHRHLHVAHSHHHVHGPGAIDPECAVNRLRHVVDGVVTRFAERGFAFHDRQAVLEQVDADNLALHGCVGSHRGWCGEHGRESQSENTENAHGLEFLFGESGEASDGNIAASPGWRNRTPRTAYRRVTGRELTPLLWESSGRRTWRGRGVRLLGEERRGK